MLYQSASTPVALEVVVHTPIPASNNPVTESYKTISVCQSRQLNADTDLIANDREELPVLVGRSWCCHLDVVNTLKLLRKVTYLHLPIQQ
jgi:hypothetical protein